MPRNYETHPLHIKITIDVAVHSSVNEESLRKNFAEFVNANEERFFEPIVDAIGSDCALHNTSLEVIKGDDYE